MTLRSLFGPPIKPPSRIALAIVLAIHATGYAVWLYLLFRFLDPILRAD